MNKIKALALTGFAATLLLATSSRTDAQVSVSIGAEPDCPYGYYDYAPFACAALRLLWP